MEKKDFKNYGIILMVLAGVLLVGILSYWSYSVWKIVDWANVTICGYIGYKLYEENK
jgi:hypothetical protein